MQNNPNLIFFGTSRFAVIVLEILSERGITPTRIVTTPDAPVGRKQILTPSPVKVWAMEHGISLLQPEKLDSSFIHQMSDTENSLFLVASYGKIIPEAILNIPKHNTLNIHPSLLPLLRGASPLQSAIISEEKTGVTIIQLDSEMDHGPIVAEKEVPITPWPVGEKTLEEILAKEGALLFEKIFPDWIAGNIIPKEQNHSQATYTRKFEKSDGEISLENDPFENYKKYLAFEEWPGVFFFTYRNKKQIRVRITEAVYQNGEFVILKVIPEGKKEMRWEDFLRGNH